MARQNRIKAGIFLLKLGPHFMQLVMASSVSYVIVAITEYSYALSLIMKMPPILHFMRT